MNNNAQPAETGLKSHAPADTRQIFDKPHREAIELLRKLEERGMTVDQVSALPYVVQVGGYRMKGYWYQWQDPASKKFREPVHFDQVIERYEFDRLLRRITGDALERIELMVRATISNVMSKHEGAHWFMKDELFTISTDKRARGEVAPNPDARPSNAPRKLKSLHERVAEEVSRMKRKPFIEHYQAKYREPALPPSWAISECLSFGSWSTAYPTLKELEYRKEISRRFKVENPDVFASWLHAFSVMRNTVFHHGRLLGALTGVTPKGYHRRDLRFEHHEARTFFASATVINYVCESIKRGPHWKTDLEDLFAKYPAIPIQQALGFPADWTRRPGWGERQA